MATEPSPDKRGEVESEDAIRARFEAWGTRMNLNMKRKGGSYAGPYADWCWQAFYCGSLTGSAPSTTPQKREWEGYCTAEEEETIKEIESIYSGNGRDWGQMRAIALMVIRVRKEASAPSATRQKPDSKEEPA